MDARLRPERGYQKNADKILASLSAVFYADGNPRVAGRVPDAGNGASTRRNLEKATNERSV